MTNTFTRFTPRQQDRLPGRLVTALRALPTKPVVYLAGKISRWDWRGYVLDEPRNPGALDYTDPDLWNPKFEFDCGTFRYGGPFFASCDHACSHVTNLHAVGSCGLCAEDSNNELDELHRKVWGVNKARLRHADVVFTYINETNCFGTLIELGIAAELGKLITVGFGRNLSEKKVADLWMAQEAALKVYRGSPAHTWASFVEDFLFQQAKAD